MSPTPRITPLSYLFQSQHPKKCRSSAFLQSLGKSLGETVWDLPSSLAKVECPQWWPTSMLPCLSIALVFLIHCGEDWPMWLHTASQRVDSWHGGFSVILRKPRTLGGESTIGFFFWKREPSYESPPFCVFFTRQINLSSHSCFYSFTLVFGWELLFLSISHSTCHPSGNVIYQECQFPLMKVFQASHHSAQLPQLTFLVAF